MAEVNRMPVNDGGGLYDNQGLCDTLIVDCNNLIKSGFAGQYIQVCNTVVSMVQKLTNLKDGIAKDLASKDKIIEELKRINDDLMEEKTGLPVERGADNGTD